MENSMVVPQNRTDLSNNPAIPLLGKYPKELKAMAWVGSSVG